MRLRSVSIVAAVMLALTTIQFREARSTQGTPTESTFRFCPANTTIAGPKDQWEPYFPDVIRVGETLLVTYYLAEAHLGTSGEIWIAKGTCNPVTGSWTWVRRVEVVDSNRAYDFRDPSLALLSNGMVLLSYFSVKLSDQTRRLHLQYSTDIGASFGPDPAITIMPPVSMVKNPATSAKIIQLANGRLVLPYYGPRPTTSGDFPRIVLLAETTPLGLPQSWTWDHRVVASAGTLSLEEPAVAQLGPTHLRVAMRVGNHNGLQTESKNYISLSDSTWTQPADYEDLGVQTQAPELLPIPLTNLGIKVFYSWSEPSGGPRHVNAKLISPDATFRDAPTFRMYTAQTGDAGYSSTTQIDVDRLFTVFYDTGTVRSILGRRSMISDWD